MRKLSVPTTVSLVCSAVASRLYSEARQIGGELIDWLIRKGLRD